MTDDLLNPIRAATLSVSNMDAAITRFRDKLEFRLVEEGFVDGSLAAALDASGLVDARYAILRPKSGRKTDLRLIETGKWTGPGLMASLGWTALEFCVADVHDAAQAVASGPFNVIGPPNRIPGLPTIYPMQIEGPDGEILFLTQILTDDAADGLPVAHGPFDVMFIAVLACRDLALVSDWVSRQLGGCVSDPVEIPYRTLSRAFDLPLDKRHTIATATIAGQIFLQLDQYPSAAPQRGRHATNLPEGVSVLTLLHPDLSTVPGPWLSPPVRRQGALYEGRSAGMLQTPEGALVELVESSK